MRTQGISGPGRIVHLVEHDAAGYVTIRSADMQMRGSNDDGRSHVDPITLPEWKRAVGAERSDFTAQACAPSGADSVMVGGALLASVRHGPLHIPRRLV